MYSKKVIENFENPANVGSIENADGVGIAGNPECGDTIELHIKVMDDTIVDIKYKTFGCAAAVASSSMLTQLAIGKNLDEALSLTMYDVAESLGGLPERKMHCSNMAEDALRLAIEDYRDNHGSKKAAD